MSEHVVPCPVQLPSHPRNCDPVLGLGFAVRTTVNPREKLFWQVGAQLIPPGLLETTPRPTTDTETADSWETGGGAGEGEGEGEGAVEPQASFEYPDTPPALNDCTR